MKATTISIDPGARTGWAQWSAEGRLLACGECVPQDVPEGPYDLVIVEYPRARRDGGASTASLVTLGVHLGQALGRTGCSHVRRVDPSEWKGAVPKPSSRRAAYIIATRAALALDDDEPRPEPAQWDAWDAVGLGLWHHRRVMRGAVS